MMKKITIAIVVLAVVVVLGGITISSIAITSDNGFKPITSNIVARSTDQIELSSEQLERIEELREEASYRVGKFEYQEKLITGEVDISAPKLDLDTALNIISENSDFNVILNEFKKIQAYPDYIGGSGVTTIEYWINLPEEDKIVIILEQGEIWYDDYDANGTLVSYAQIFG